jgi:FKBP-type peptidyl-prolyl cis-trans isomerase FklB
MMAAAMAAVLAIFPAASAQAGDLSAQANAAFLAANKAKPGVVVRPSGLQYRVIKAGAGRTPKPTDWVRIFYRGTLIDGTMFDENQPGAAARFKVGELIPGWIEGLSLMREGDRWELVVPANLAYGERGGGATIPANQALVFEMELLEVE